MKICAHVLALVSSLVLISTSALAAQNDQATDVSGPAAGSTVAGGIFSPSGTNPVTTAATVEAVASAAQSTATAISGGSIPGFTGSVSTPTVQAVVNILTAGGSNAAAPAPGAPTAQQTVQQNMIGGLGLPAAQVNALLASVAGLLPSPQPAQLQRAVSAWNDLCRATPPAALPSLAAAEAPQAIRAVLSTLVGATPASQ